MHVVIYTLAQEVTHNDALATGKTVFDCLVGVDPHTGAVFDYFVTFDREDTSVAGKARWGELPTAAPVDSDDGQDLLERGWEATKEEFERNLKRVKEVLDGLSDEEIMRGEDLARHAFHQVVRTTARRSSCTSSTQPTFATVDSWTDSSKRVRSAGSCPLTSTSE